VKLMPIVARELQVAARRRSTFQIRFLSAAGATVLGGWFLLASTLPGGLAVTGRGLFSILTVLALVLALFSGTLLTADCLSREKREGTLGFLFLTDLSGWDVVFGKFAGLALVPLQGVLAVFPMVAISVFLGGVTEGEFWRTLWVVVTAVMASLALGMWVSSRVTDGRLAAWGSFLLMTAWVLVPFLPGVAEVPVPSANGVAWGEILGFMGPYVRAQHALYATGRGAYWLGIGVQWVLAVGFLRSAGNRVRRDWRWAEARAVAPAEVSTRHGSWWVPGFLLKMEEGRRSILRRQGNLAWLSWQAVWVRRLATGVAIATALAAGTVFGSALMRRPFIGGSDAAMVVATGLYVLKVMLVVHTVYFLHEVGRNGMLESLLITPVSGAAMWNGHLAGVRAIFLWPVTGLAALQIGLGVWGKIATGGDWPSLAALLFAGFLAPVLTLAVHGLDFLAVAYASARWALRYEHAGKAVFRTVLMVLVLPGIFCNYGRFFVDLIIVAQCSRMLEPFRDRVREWFLQGDRVPQFTPRPPRLGLR